MKHTGRCWSLGDFYRHIFKHLWDFFLGIPDEQFNLGHWSFPLTISSMEPRKYTTDRIRTRKALSEVIKLRDNIYRSSGTLVGAKSPRHLRGCNIYCCFSDTGVLIPQDYKHTDPDHPQPQGPF